MANNDDDGDIRTEVETAIESISSNNASKFSLFSLLGTGGPLNETEMVAVAEALSHSAHVEELNIIWCIEGASAPAASRFLSNIFETHPSLREIVLSYNNLNSESVEVIGNSFKNNTSLEVLNLSNNHIGSRGAEALAEGLSENDAMQTIQLNNNNIGPRGAEALARGLRNNNTLEKIHLANSNVGPMGAKALAEGLSENNTMQTIYLGNNSIGSRGAEALAEGLRRNNSLQEIDLCENDIGPCGAEALAEVLRENSALQSIDLRGNEIGAGGAQALAEALRINKTLVTINIYNNGIGPLGGVALAEVFEPRSPEDQAEGLHHNNTLREIYLGGNDIGDETAVAIADALRINSSLLEISLNGSNRITNVGAKAIEDTLKHMNYTVEDIYLDQGTGVSQDLRDRIDHLCDQNVCVKAFFQQVNQNIPAIALGVWPTVLAAVEGKPDFLFALLKSKPEVVREVQRGEGGRVFKRKHHRISSILSDSI